MKKNTILRSVAALSAALLAVSCGGRPSADTYDMILARFQSPPAEFRPAPLWVWNDRMSEKQIKDQLADFKEHGIGGVFVHPRPGLITPYLSEEWLSLFKHAVEVGRELGLKVWIYDENSYPSGFAGGHVPAEMPEALISSLKLVKVEGAPGRRENPVAAVFLRTPTGFLDVTAGYDPADPSGLGPGSYYVFEIVKPGPSPWYGGFNYVDLMRKEVTEKFLDVTLNRYKEAVGAEFGKTIPGTFQDEAEISPRGGRDTINYSPALFSAFLKKWGYDLRPNLISLVEPFGEWKRIRHNYYSTLLDLFIENWAKPYYSYCADNNLALTGHYWEHEWPVPRVSPDNLAMAAYAQVPGIDILMNQWDRGPHAQFGNARSVREIRSAANQFGRSRTLSETYGASGWDLTFRDQKRIGDWEYALGVNLLNQHLSYVTIKGARKRDHPLSFSYHQPWWPLYRELADYFGRLSAVMASGEQVNRIAVIEPTTTAWMYYSPSGPNEKLGELGNDFQKFVNLLEENHVEYDLVSEKALQEYGRVGYRKLVVGRRGYELVILPPGLENINDSTLPLLREYMLHKGRILSWVAPPDYVNGIVTNELRVLQRSYGDRWFDSGPDGFRKLRELLPPGMSFTSPETDPWLFHQRRQFDGGQLIFLANTSLERDAEGDIALESGGSVEKWDPFTGSVESYPFSRGGDGVVFHYGIPPAGSLLLCVREERKPIVKRGPSAVDAGELQPLDGISVRREDENVLTLDYCDLVLDGKVARGLYFYEAQTRAYKRHGFEGDPWDSSVQFKSSILDRDRFPADSGFEAVFRFEARKSDAYDFQDLKAVVERPELFQVFVNGVQVKPLPGEWRIDRDFGVYPVGRWVVSGGNRLTVRARPFSVHAELEPVYMVGDFRLEAAKQGFVLKPPRELGLGTWAAQGLPFYGARVSYTGCFDVGDRAEAGRRYFVRLGAWDGVAAEVLVNGRRAGLVAFPPFELDVTDALQPGPNDVSVVVYGSLRNTLGPFHGDPPSGSAWPGMFKQGPSPGPPPGAAYKVVDYGLKEGFKLITRTEQKSTN
jgi:hypothetical protein